jgi:hypothetical protein
MSSNVGTKWASALNRVYVLWYMAPLVCLGFVGRRVKVQHYQASSSGRENPPTTQNTVFLALGLVFDFLERTGWKAIFKFLICNFLHQWNWDMEIREGSILIHSSHLMV